MKAIAAEPIEPAILIKSVKVFTVMQMNVVIMMIRDLNASFLT